ncbi:MAG: DUF3386 family protein, partial [Planctomycetes bacterium]|nr:DUF3386 family protein [Planctomycetota bacterium]
MKSFQAPLILFLFALASSAELRGQPKEDPKADPAASKLLAEARAARATWENFPGFTADIEVVIEGKASRGQLQVNSNGRVRLDKLGKEAEAWASPMLSSIMSHRLDGGDL